MSLPAVAVAGPLFSILRSARRCTLVVRQLWSFWGLVSSVGLLAFTVAQFWIGPVVSGAMCTVMSKLVLALGASVPTEQLTVFAVLVQPPVAETKLVPAGSGSLTVPPLEVEGPRLVTTR